MFRTKLYVGALVAVAFVPQLSRAQQAAASSPPRVDSALAAEANVSLDSARTIALHRVRNGHVAAEELEREHGRLIYSFDVKVPGKSGIQEVNVNAITGVVIDVHHESAATEAREAREDGVAVRKAAALRAKPPE